jgi:hypothetical protein
MKEIQIKIETLQNMLVDIATGGSGDDVEFKKLRSDMLERADIKDMIPDFIKTNRTTSQFWQFIKAKFTTYGERRKFIWDEFTPLLDYVEGKRSRVAEKNLTDKIKKMTQSYISDEWSKALGRKTDDPEGAITTARTLIETTCKFILDNLKMTYKDDAELPKLYKLTAENLNLAPDQHTEQIFKQILGGCQTIVEGLGALRNKLSDSHGRKSTQARPTSRHAELAVNLAGTMTTFLLETYELKIIKPSKTI